MNPMNRYIPEPLRESGITYRQLDYWCRRGYLRPLGDAEGSGRPRWWPASEIEIARRMVDLIDQGFTVSTAAVKARELAAA